MKVVGYYRERVKQHNDWRYAMQNIEQAILIELVLLTGLRPSEALRGRWEDVTDDTWMIWGRRARPGPVTTSGRIRRSGTRGRLETVAPASVSSPCVERARFRSGRSGR